VTKCVVPPSDACQRCASAQGTRCVRMSRDTGPTLCLCTCMWQRTQLLEALKAGLGRVSLSLGLGRLAASHKHVVRAKESACVHTPCACTSVPHVRAPQYPMCKHFRTPSACTSVHHVQALQYTMCMHFSTPCASSMGWWGLTVVSHCSSPLELC